MWKLILAFILFAAVAIFVISKGGDSLDMGGEKHGADATEAHSPVVAAPASATVPPAGPIVSGPAPASAASQ